MEKKSAKTTKMKELNGREQREEVESVEQKNKM